MTLKNIQKDVHVWTSQFKTQYWQPHEILAHLTEEVGELAREINHRWGSKPKKPTESKAELAEEITDIFFTLCCLANSQDIDLDNTWQKMMQKYEKRDNERFEKK
jgi:NTP pyrophosphatase (non-canonical NTP hydrolase)